MAERLKVLLLSTKVKVICWSSIDIMLGKMSLLQKHQRLGLRSSLELKAKGLKFSLLNQLVGKWSNCIQGSDKKMKFGLCATIKFLRANLEGALAIPLMFQNRHFIEKSYLEP